jgi:hypothetical protein
MSISEEEQKLEGTEVFTTGVNKIVQKKEKEKETILPLITKKTVNKKKEKKKVEKE